MNTSKVGILFILVVAFLSNSFSQNTRQWVAHVSGTSKSGSNSGTAMAIDRSGNLLVTGWVTNTGTPGIDIVTIKYAPDGEELKRVYYSGSGTDKALAIAVDSGRNVYITGITSAGSSNFNFITIKYDSNLQQLWATPQQYNGPGNGDDQPVAIAVNDSLNVFVTGWSKGDDTNFDYVTIKYNSIGEEKWVKRYNGPANSVDSALGMVLYRNADVFVTGTSVDSGYDYFTIKYSPTSGDSLWSSRYNGFGLGNDVARGIVRNSDGEIFIAGSSQNAVGDYDYLAIAYSSSGTQQWESRYNGPTNTNDYASAIGLSGTNRIYVTGKSINTGTFNDIVTVCFAQNDGDSNWVRSYNGTANDEDIGIATTGGNNPYFIGSSVGTGVGKDYALIQHNGNNGNLNLQVRYNGYANSDDVPYALVSSSGAVYVTGTSKKLKGSEILTIKFVDEEDLFYRSFIQESLALKAVSLKSSAKPNEGTVCEEAMKLAYPKIKRGYAGYPGGMYVGNANPDSASSYGWMRFEKGKSVSAYLPDTGAARYFDLYNDDPFVGEKKNPKKDKHNNRLAGELIALKIGIGASDAGITPPMFGDLRYDDGNSLNPYRDKTLRQIAALADNYLTYGSRYPSVVWNQLDTVLTRINHAFHDTLKIVSRQALVVTGVRLLDSVWYLKEAIAPLIEPLAFDRSSLDLVPEKFELYQNYPNPFNPTTTISFDLPEASLVTLKIYDMLGREVETVFDEIEFEEGNHEILYDASSLATGVYFYRTVVNGGEHHQIKKMLLVK
ncbi:MAG: T9SS type A sorting domain-containing protein [Ignavibacteriales bacterium]|nr:T9SS type A sorting domain-containing protein [Ignavibacteriales bacterium]